MSDVLIFNQVGKRGDAFPSRFTFPTSTIYASESLAPEGGDGLDGPGKEGRRTQARAPRASDGQVIRVETSPTGSLAGWEHGWSKVGGQQIGTLGTVQSSHHPSTILETFGFRKGDELDESY